MPWRHCSPMTAKGPVNGPTTPILTVDFSAAVAGPATGRTHSNTAANRGVHELIITLLADGGKTAWRFLTSFLLPWKKIVFTGRGQEGFEPAKAPLGPSFSGGLAA